MNINDIIKDAEKAPLSMKVFYELAFDVVDRVHELLEKQGKTQKDLAHALGKLPSEVSKWLTGQHNLTLKSIAAIEAALGEPVVVTPGKGRESFEEGKFKPAFEKSGHVSGFKATLTKEKYGPRRERVGAMSPSKVILLGRKGSYNESLHSIA